MAKCPKIKCGRVCRYIIHRIDVTLPTFISTQYTNLPCLNLAEKQGKLVHTKKNTGNGVKLHSVKHSELSR